MIDIDHKTLQEPTNMRGSSPHKPFVRRFITIFSRQYVRSDLRGCFQDIKDRGIDFMKKHLLWHKSHLFLSYPDFLFEVLIFFNEIVESYLNGCIKVFFEKGLTRKPWLCFFSPFDGGNVAIGSQVYMGTFVFNSCATSMPSLIQWFECRRAEPDRVFSSPIISIADL